MLPSLLILVNRYLKSDDLELFIQFSVLQGLADFFIQARQFDAEGSSALLFREKQIVPASVVNGLQIGHVEDDSLKIG